MTTTITALTTADRRHALVTLTAADLADDDTWRARVSANLGAESTAFVAPRRC